MGWWDDRSPRLVHYVALMPWDFWYRALRPKCPLSIEFNRCDALRKKHHKECMAQLPNCMFVPFYAVQCAMDQPVLIGCIFIIFIKFHGLLIASQVWHYLLQKLHDLRQKRLWLRLKQRYTTNHLDSPEPAWSQIALPRCPWVEKASGFGCALRVSSSCFSPDRPIFMIQVAFCRQAIQQGKLHFHCRSEIYRTSPRLNRVLWEDHVVIPVHSLPIS